MVMKKRGLSDVVTTSLIVLLAIAAVVIVWSFVKPMLENTGNQVQSTDCLSASLKPIACDVVANTVRVEAGTGNAAVKGARIIVYDAAGVALDSRLASVCADFSPLDIQTCTTGYDIQTGQKVAVAPIIVNNMTCTASSQITC